MSLTEEPNVAYLEERVKSLQEELESKCEDLHLAAEFGKQLLDSNSELTTQLENACSDYTNKIEELEQQRYSLQMKLDQKTSLEESYKEEIESLQHSLKRQKEEQDEFKQAEHNAQIAELRNEISQAKADMERHQLTERQLQEQKAQLEVILKETQEQLEQKMNMMNETCSEELMQLHVEVKDLHMEKVSLKQSLAEVQHELEQQLQQNHLMQNQLQLKEQEVEEKMCQMTSYFNALEKSREENMELRVQLDVAKMESQNMKKKGNSLFSEVEDRRVQAEKELVSLKVQYNSLKRQYILNKEHLHMLKVQVTSLLQMSTGKADREHVESLQTQLSQAHSEVRELLAKLNTYEKQQKTSAEQLTISKLVEGQAGGNYVSYVQALLKLKEDELSKLENEMKTTKMQMLAESEKVLQRDRKLYVTQQQLDRLEGQNMKLRLKIEEMQMKYEPYATKSGRTTTQQKGKLEKIPLETLPESVENGNDSHCPLLLEAQPGKEPTPVYQQEVVNNTSVRLTPPNSKASEVTALKRTNPDIQNTTHQGKRVQLVEPILNQRGGDGAPCRPRPITRTSTQEPNQKISRVAGASSEDCKVQ